MANIFRKIFFVFKKIAEHVIFSCQETAKFYKRKYGGRFSLFTWVIGYFLFCAYTKNLHQIFGDIMTHFLCFVAPIGIITILVFIWNFIRSDLKIELERKNNPLHQCKITDEKKHPYEEVLSVVSKYYRIFIKEWRSLPQSHNKALVKQYRDDAKTSFTCLLDMPEIAANDSLYKLIVDISVITDNILGMAGSVSHDSDELEKAEKYGNTDIMSIVEFYSISENLIKNFVTLKNQIFEYCK